MKRTNRKATEHGAKGSIKDCAVFRTSSFCNGGTCVAVAKRADGTVLVRDAKDADKQSLAFTHAEWAAFVRGVKNNEFEV